MNKYYWLIPILPLLGSAFNGLLGKRAGKGAVTFVGLGVVLGSLLLAISAFLTMKGMPDHRLVLGYGEWMATGTLQVPFDLAIDPLSGTMMLVVTGIGFLIHLYSVGYMHEDEGYARFFCYLNLFVFFMLTLVLGSSLVLMFVGWEGVGLCSYLLIGYFFETDFAPDAGLKAFLTNRVGDLGVAIGMMVLFAAFGTLTVGDILTQAGHLAPEVGFGVLTFATLMLFFGATGKSAQLPLYLWLPDAMAGPTPVSALIHAATMVTSGIYMICRLAPVFTLAPITMDVVAWVGAGTALFAATIGLVQRDIKKVLAYSTVSQLGYMFLGLGASGFAAGFFHVFTHAWFKALLFLGAGSVIHAMHHEQDLFKMGGLKAKMPATFWTMLVATLAIIGFPGTSGFASKDEILYLAYLKNPMLWVIGVVAACCTAFYMLRLFTLTFLGKPRDHHAFDHAHESPVSMTLPLALLAVGTVLAVWLGWPKAFGGDFRIEAWLAPATTFGQLHGAHGEHGSHALAWGLASVSTLLGLSSAAFGYFSYKDGLAVSEARAAQFPFLHRLLLNKYYVDEGVELYLLRPIRWFGNLLWKLFDVILIDGVGVNLPGALTRVSGDFTALFQTGRVRNYALSMALGAAVLLYVFLK
ncbi:MAG: NADH-quinone oxidoreductase subunit L [Holophagaceae bacterium]|uniref:NADH-quinone oxidoreductase subunit L n=1 Tax=Candidatus Geothrix skivensis TaxID=2954439 RepID=A0A9D7XH25_9BACT|nr:NADH-quinone oxidoreductase subunit L [Candidatus Geothrix skivensis]